MKLHCDIQLPASKSENNRALMIAAYGGFAPDFQNLSDSNDTFVLSNALREIQQNKSVIDIADCGTAARFLTTYLACRKGEWVLTGTERMKQRPIAPLVEALRGLGSDIQYVEKDKCLPLRIVGKPIEGGKVQIEMHQSSQFASSLLLAAPMWAQGLEMELLGELSSLPYLEMTLAMMRHFGADVERNGRTIVVRPKPYQSKSFTVEADWSAASYWYEMAALSEECEIRLRGLSLPSLQGDAVIVDWMKLLGVGTFVENDAIVLRKIPFEKRPLQFDFSAHPDLFPTMAATCAAMQIEARFSGISNLNVKESDRLRSMENELIKIGVEMNKIGDESVLIMPCSHLPSFDSSQPLLFSAHNDHRVVMSLAPLALRIGAICFDDMDVVRKSYPHFWSDVSFVLENSTEMT